MDVAAFAQRLEALAVRLFPTASNNKFAKQQAVKQLIDIVTGMTVAEFSEVRNGLTDGLVSDSQLSPLSHRLELLSHRLEEEGRYVDANIAFLAFEELGKAALAKAEA